MTRLARRLLPLPFLTVALAAGCLRRAPSTPSIDRGLPGDRGVPASSPGAGGTSTGTGDAGGAGVSQKVVAGKEEPVTLVATDRARCQVTEQKFRETSIGERVWCAWTPGRSPSRVP